MMKALRFILLILIFAHLSFPSDVLGAEYSGSQLSTAQGSVLAVLTTDNLHAKKQQIKVHKIGQFWPR